MTLFHPIQRAWERYVLTGKRHRVLSPGSFEQSCRALRLGAWTGSSPQARDSPDLFSLEALHDPIDAGDQYPGPDGWNDDPAHLADQFR
jgi:hypothetical protein